MGEKGRLSVMTNTTQSGILDNEHAVVYAGFVVVALVAACVLTVTFIQNGGMANCKSSERAPPSSKSNKAAGKDDADNKDQAAKDGEDDGDADEEAPKEAWGDDMD